MRATSEGGKGGGKCSLALPTRKRAKERRGEGGEGVSVVEAASRLRSGRARGKEGARASGLNRSE